MIALHRKLAHAFAQMLTATYPSTFEEIVLDALVLGVLTIHPTPTAADLGASLALSIDLIVLRAIDAHAQRVLGADYARVHRRYLSNGRLNRAPAKRVRYYLELYREELRARGPQGLLDPLIDLRERHPQVCERVRLGVLANFKLQQALVESALAPPTLSLTEAA